MIVKCLPQEHNAVPRLGLKPRLLNLESSALTIRPLCLPTIQCVLHLFFHLCVHRITLSNQHCFLFFPADDLPMRGFIGHLEEGGFLPHTHKVFLWAHLNFNIEFNGDQVLVKICSRAQI